MWLIVEKPLLHPKCGENLFGENNYLWEEDFINYQPEDKTKQQQMNVV